MNDKVRVASFFALSAMCFSVACDTSNDGQEFQNIASTPPKLTTQPTTTRSSNAMTIDEIIAAADPDYPADLANEVDKWIDQRVHYDETKSQFDLSRLNEDEKLVWRLSRFEGELVNGGIVQFFYNCGQESQYIIKSLREIGAANHLRLMEQAASVFPDGVVPENKDVIEVLIIAGNIEQARELWGRLDESEYEGEISVRLGEYIKTHTGRFH